MNIYSLILEATPRFGSKYGYNTDCSKIKSLISKTGHAPRGHSGDEKGISLVGSPVDEISPQNCQIKLPSTVNRNFLESP